MPKAMFAVLRSSAFFATLVSSYQMLFCSHRALLNAWNQWVPAVLAITRDHRWNYYVFGLISGLSIFIESKSRRSELSLYALPKAAESLYGIMLTHGAWRIPHGVEGLIFMLASGGVMSLYVSEPTTLSPFLHRILRYFAGKSI